MNDYSPICLLMRWPDSGLPDPATLGRRMAALYAVWRDDAGVDLAGLADRLLDPLGAAGQPIGRACLAMARAVMHWGGLPYHSALHHAEVALNVTVLATIAERMGQALTLHHRALLLAASLGHDYGYRRGGQRFEVEAEAARAMDAICADHGVAATDRQAISGLILATEPGFRSVLSGATPQAALPSELRALLAQPDLVMVAAYLADADLLSSAGLTVGWNQVQHHRLERELGRVVTLEENAAFFEKLVGSSFLSLGGRHFVPNLIHIGSASSRRPDTAPERLEGQTS